MSHAPADCLILTHGAGSNRDAPLLIAMEDALDAAGIETIRMDLPFRQHRPAGPPRRGDAERDRSGLAEAVQRAAAEHAGRVYLGGHSYGGRQASMLAAGQPGLVSGLLLLSYPLHPPRQPDQLRTAHFKDLHTPVLFVHGTRDPFGSVEELRAASALIPGRTSLVEMEGAGHELAKSGPAALNTAANRIVREFSLFFINR